MYKEVSLSSREVSQSRQLNQLSTPTALLFYQNFDMPFHSHLKSHIIRFMCVSHLQKKYWFEVARTILTISLFQLCCVIPDEQFFLKLDCSHKYFLNLLMSFWVKVSEYLLLTKPAHKIICLYRRHYLLDFKNR